MAAPNPNEVAEATLKTAMGRIQTTAVDVASRTATLSLLRALALLHNLPDVAAATWLPQVKVCRAMSQLDAASTAVLEAEKAGVPTAFITRAKLLWDRGDHKRVRVSARRFCFQIKLNDCWIL